MSLRLGDIAPDFEQESSLGRIKFHEWLGDSWGVLFSHPADFTPVCTTELGLTAKLASEFEKRNVAVVACSTDTEQSHWGWLQMDKKNGGIKGVTYPIVADTTKTISANFDVLTGEYDVNEKGELVATGSMIAYRGLFLIDKQGIVRHQTVNDLSLGRNVDEAIRMVDALQFNEENGEVCPANWTKGKEGMKASHTGVADYLAKH